MNTRTSSSRISPVAPTARRLYRRLPACVRRFCHAKSKSLACQTLYSPGAVILSVALFSIFIASQTLAKEMNTPVVYGLPAYALTQAKAKITAGDASVQPAFKKLIQDADKALKMKPVSVMEKPKPGASGDKHDYFSTAPYFWPDPSKPDGLPYIRKDGYKNPESHNEFSDSPRMGKMAGAVYTLGLAYYFTGKETYAEHAAKLLHVWFLDPETRMNPNFNQAQAVPGVNTGRGTGMIESRSLASVMDGVGLLQGSRHWSKPDEEGMVKWIRDFLDWAQTSKIGKAEKAAKNNHGSFYDMQTTHMALFTGQKELAKKIVESAKTNRIDRQFKPDGSQPLELAREDSFGYSRFNLQALFDLAGLGEYVGIDLWHYPAADSPVLKRGLDFLLPYAEDPRKEWPYEHEKKASHDLHGLLRQAWLVYHDDRYLKAFQKTADTGKERDSLFYPVQ